MKGLRECAFAAQTETSELREFGAQEAEVSLSEEIKRLQSSLSDRDQELAGKCLIIDFFAVLSSAPIMMHACIYHHIFFLILFFRKFVFDFDPPTNAYS